jgi:hypothetical protein
MMPNVPIDFIRGVLAFLCLFFGHMGGRSAALVVKGRQKPTRLYTWILRMLACSWGLTIRHPIDTLVLGVWGLELIVFGIGYWMVQHAKPPEDLTRELFPE